MTAKRRAYNLYDALTEREKWETIEDVFYYGAEEGFLAQDRRPNSTGDERKAMMNDIYQRDYAEDDVNETAFCEAFERAFIAAQRQQF